MQLWIDLYNQCVLINTSITLDKQAEQDFFQISVKVNDVNVCMLEDVFCF